MYLISVSEENLAEDIEVMAEIEKENEAKPQTDNGFLPQECNAPERDQAVPMKKSNTQRMTRVSGV